MLDSAPRHRDDDDMLSGIMLAVTHWQAVLTCCGTSSPNGVVCAGPMQDPAAAAGTVETPGTHRTSKNRTRTGPGLKHMSVKQLKRALTFDQNISTMQG